MGADEVTNATGANWKPVALRNLALPRGVVQKLGCWIFNNLHGSISCEVRRSVGQIQS
jgi:hypothetical protein